MRTNGARAVECPVCGSDNSALYKPRSLSASLTSEDLKITDKRYGLTLELWRCNRCGFVFATGKDLLDLTALYAQLNDYSYEAMSEPRALQMRWLLDWVIAKAPNARSLLDVGAGVGLLVAEAGRLGLDAVGVEPSASLAETARRDQRVMVVTGTLPATDLSDRRFDIVTLVDVIEHVADPVDLLRKCSGYLAPGGSLLVVTPNVASLAARLFGSRWWHFRLAHVGYFNPRSLNTAVSKAGLRIASETRPRWFFPVAYLAERTAQYLPIGAAVRFGSRYSLIRWVYSKTVPLDLRDSVAVLLERDI